METVPTLQPGDILVFESDGSHIDELIMLLTESDVAHSALYYGKETQGKDILVDAATGCGIAGHLMKVLQTGETPPPGSKWAPARGIYVRRYETPSPLTPVLLAAKGYELENNGFNWMGLIALGLHLLFRMDPQPDKVARLLAELLEMLTSELWQIISHSKTGKKGPHPMYCSQFVSQCFTKGGFPLQINKPRLELVPSTTMLDWIASSPISLVTLQAQAERYRRLRRRTADQIVEDLYDALYAHPEPRDKSAAEVSRNPSPELVLATLEFGQALQQVQEVRESMTFVTGLDFLKKLQDTYVTPADLKENCSSLMPIENRRISLNEDSCPLPWPV